MIDTVKIYSMVSKEIYDIIHLNSIIKTSYCLSTGEVFYNIINDHLKGSYDTNLSVRVDNGSKYKFIDKYYIEIEGSYHKIMKGYNSHNGYYNLCEITLGLINLVENAYNIKLPSLEHWFLQRIDIALCFDLENNSNVIRYIDNLRKCDYPRRELKSQDYKSSLNYPRFCYNIKNI